MKRIHGDSLSGKIHNAKKVTVDGRDLFIAAVERGGRFNPSEMMPLEEFDTVHEAEAWLRGKLQSLGEAEAVITKDGC